MEVIIVPQEFAILFSIPIIGFFVIANRSYSFWPAFTFYISAQVGLAALARYLYG